VSTRNINFPQTKKLSKFSQTIKPAKKNGPGKIAGTILFTYGAADRNRTDMVSLPHDFEIQKS
jgi:hypothetical protein